MELLIKAKDLHVEYTGREVLDIDELQLYDYDRIGLVGTNDAAKKNKTESGGRLAHQKTMGSKQKTLYNAAKSMENRVAALGEVEAPENIRTICFRQSKALELHNPYPICGTEINKSFGDKVLFEKASFSIPLGARCS